MNKNLSEDVIKLFNDYNNAIRQYNERLARTAHLEMSIKEVRNICNNYERKIRENGFYDDYCNYCEWGV